MGDKECHLEDPKGGERITLRWILGKQVVRVGEGYNWSKIEPNDVLRY
jgi:hypothetical protein